MLIHQLVGYPDRRTGRLVRAFTRRFRGNAIPIAYRSPPPVSPLWLRLQAEVEGPLARRACSDLTGQAAAAAALAVSVTAAASATAKTSITAALSAVKPSTQSASSRRSGPARREPTDLAAVNVNQAARGLPPDVGRWRRVQGGGARLQVAISSACRTGLAEPAEQVPGPLGGGRRPSAACGRPRVNDLDAGAIEVRQVASGKYRAAGAADGGDKSVETSDRLPSSLAGTGNNRVLLSSSCIDWQDLLIEGPEGVVRGI